MPTRNNREAKRREDLRKHAAKKKYKMSHPSGTGKYPKRKEKQFVVRRTQERAEAKAAAESRVADERRGGETLSPAFHYYDPPPIPGRFVRTWGLGC
jgi:hypothetical protein